MRSLKTSKLVQDRGEADEAVRLTLITDRSSISIKRGLGAPRSCRGLLGIAVRGHKLGGDPREACNHVCSFPRFLVPANSHGSVSQPKDLALARRLRGERSA